MARVRLGRSEATQGDLPLICMRCGDVAVDYKGKLFSWHPSWAYALLLLGLLPFAIVALVLTKRMRIRAPLCADHMLHWTWRTLFTLGGLAVLVVLGIAAAVLAAVLENRPNPQHLGGFVCAAVAVLGFAWLITAAIVQSEAIRPTEITDRSISLINVSPEFVEAYQRKQRRRDEEEDEDYRAPRRRRRYYAEEEDEDDWDRR